MKVTVLVGNPKANSRTRVVAEQLAARMVGPLPAAEVRTLELADYAERVFRWPDEVMAEVTAGVAASDLLVVACPTYKAAYTGLLKAFLDRYPSNGLAGTPAVPVMTGADRGHALAPATTLAPLLAELGALVPGRGLFFETSMMDRLHELLDRWMDDQAAEVALVRLAALRPPAAGVHA